VWRPLIDPAPTIDFVLGYDKSNASPLLKVIVEKLGSMRGSKTEDLKG